MKKLAFLTPAIVLAACLSGCEDTGDTDGSGDDAGSSESDDDSSGEGDDDAADDDTADDDAADDDAADDDTADDDAADDDTADDDTADDDASDDDAADDDTADDDTADDDASDDDTADDDTDGGADDDLSDDDVEGDGGADDDTADDDVGDVDGGGGGDTILKSGSVSLTQSVFAAGPVEIVTSTAGASFVIQQFNSGDPSDVGFETETVGDCTLTIIDTTTDPGTSTGTTTNVSAGDVAIAGLAEDITLTPETDATYMSYSSMAALWEGGETMTASAPGSDDMPAFELELVAPSPVTLTEPVIDIVMPVEISRSAALDFAWDGGDEGLVTVTLAVDVTDELRSITCQIAAAEGGVTVSEQLLGQFENGDGAISVALTASSTSTVEDWSLVLSASQSVALGSATFTD